MHKNILYALICTKKWKRVVFSIRTPSNFRKRSPLCPMKSDALHPQCLVTSFTAHSLGTQEGMLLLSRPVCSNFFSFFTDQLLHLGKKAPSWLSSSFQKKTYLGLWRKSHSYCHLHPDPFSWSIGKELYDVYLSGFLALWRMMTIEATGY